MIGKNYSIPVHGFSRRSFLSGLLLGAGSVVTGDYMRTQLTTISSEVAVSGMPAFDTFPVTKYDDFYLLFMNVGQTLLPRVRRLSEYQKNEPGIFREVWKKNFFLYANDYAFRFQQHYGEPSLIKPHDKEVAEKYLVKSIQTYPEAWSQIIYTMLTHSPDVLLAYFAGERT